MTKNRLSIAAGPFVFGSMSSIAEMWLVSLTLLPALLFGVYSYGYEAGLVVLVAVLSAVGLEALVSGARRSLSVIDGSAFLTGLLIGLSMPPRVGLLIPALASAFAIGVVKLSFGGLGTNWMNPALAGTAFAYLGWPEAMKGWLLPRSINGVVGVSGATPNALLHDSIARSITGGNPVETLRNGGMAMGDGGGDVTRFLNEILSPFNVDIPKGYFDFLLGNSGGAIGECAGVFLIAGSLLLIALGIVRWQIVLPIFASYAVSTFIFGGLQFGNGFFSGDVLFGVFSGSFLLVALYMATDPVTSPDGRRARLLYGALVGLLVFAFRSLGAMFDGAAYAVLVMNCFTPLLERALSGRAGVKGRTA